MSTWHCIRHVANSHLYNLLFYTHIVWSITDKLTKSKKMSKIGRYAQASRVTMRMPETSGALGLESVFCCSMDIAAVVVIVVVVVSPFTRAGRGPIRCIEPCSHMQAGYSSYLYTYLSGGAKDGTDRAAAWRLKWIPILTRTGITQLTGQKAFILFLLSYLVFFFEGLT